MTYRHYDTIDLPPIGVVLFSYGFVPTEIRSYTAPVVRVKTGKLFNHGTLFVFYLGEYWLYESAEDGVVRWRLWETIDRKKARIQIHEYTGSLTPEEVFTAANALLFIKYDKLALLYQLFYRDTLFLANNVNHFIGRQKFGGWWLGPKGEAAKAKVGCFEFIFNVLNLPDAHLASGAEFVKCDCFNQVPLFSELN